MTETEISPESPHFNRDQVLAVFKRLADCGFASPDDLPLDDPEVIKANEVLDAWSKEAEQRAEQNPAPDADLVFSLSRSTIHVDAGFKDSAYLDEVANDWLAGDCQRAEDAGLVVVATRIQAKIDEINAQLKR